MKKQQYVVGFLYNKTRDCVALIRKNRPDWQKGLLNGIGGKVEEAEGVYDAMVREFQEEAGMKLYGWTLLCTLTFSDAQVFFYCMIGDLSKIKRELTDEVIELHHITAIPRLETLENLKWLVPLGAYRLKYDTEDIQVFNYPVNPSENHS